MVTQSQVRKRLAGHTGPQIFLLTIFSPVSCFPFVYAKVQILFFHLENHMHGQKEMPFLPTSN